MGAKLSVLGLIMSFFPVSQVCDGTVSLWNVDGDLDFKLKSLRSIQ